MGKIVSQARFLVGRWVEMVGMVHDRGMGWPRVSITVWSLVDATPLDQRRAEGSASRPGSPRDLPPNAITVVGRFCGANLCGGLTGPPPSRDAWVLLDGEAAMWVVGRPPRGKGWSLDPSHQGDTRHWVEVVGRIDRCGQAPCLRAKRVALAAPPWHADAGR